MACARGYMYSSCSTRVRDERFPSEMAQLLPVYLAEDGPGGDGCLQGRGGLGGGVPRWIQVEWHDRILCAFRLAAEGRRALGVEEEGEVLRPEHVKHRHLWAGQERGLVSRPGGGRGHASQSSGCFSGCFSGCISECFSVAFEISPNSMLSGLFAVSPL